MAQYADFIKMLCFLYHCSLKPAVCSFLCFQDQETYVGRRPAADHGCSGSTRGMSSHPELPELTLLSKTAAMMAHTVICYIVCDKTHQYGLSSEDQGLLFDEFSSDFVLK